MELIVELEHPPRSLNPNGRAPHWAVLAELKRKAKFRAFLAARQAIFRAKADGFRPQGYRVRWFYKGMRPDADNCVAACKAYLDGCAKAFATDDRDWRLDGCDVVHELTRGKVLELVFFGEVRPTGKEAAHG